MEHYAQSSVAGRLLFHTWTEGVVLYQRLCRALPTALAIVVMPDHFHALVPRGGADGLGPRLQGYAHWLNRRHDQVGTHLFQRATPPDRVRGSQQVARTVRYIWLNPCRARLTDDPLRWPLSNYRDALGLGLTPHRPAVRNATTLHRFVATDTTTSFEAALFPRPAATPSLADVERCAAWLARTSLRTVSNQRLVAGIAARERIVPRGTLVEQLGVSHRTISRAANDPPPPGLEHILGDPRFLSLPPGDLTHRRWKDWLHLV